MNILEILGAIVVCLLPTAIYVIYNAQKRTKLYAQKLMSEQPTPPPQQTIDEMVERLTTVPPSGKLANPKILELESQLDEVYAKMEDVTLKLSERLKLSEKEDELVGQMTTIFIQEGDRQIYGELRNSLNSGSKS